MGKYPKNRKLYSNQLMNYFTADVFVSYAWNDKDSVIPILDKLVRCGIKITKDQVFTPTMGGLQLIPELVKAMKTKKNKCAIIFISHASMISKNVDREIQGLLELRKKGSHIIPVLLESFNSLVFSRVFEQLLLDDHETQSALYFMNDQSLVVNLTRSILDHYEFDKSSGIVFHAGHRLSSDVIMTPPKKWKKRPMLDFRLQLHHNGDLEYYPTLNEWRELQDGLRITKNALDEINEIFLIGKSPIGISALMAKSWSGGSNSKLSVYNEERDEEWEYNNNVKLSPQDKSIEVTNIIDGDEILNIFIGSQENILKEVQNYIKQEQSLIWIKTPTNIDKKGVNVLIHEILTQMKELSIDAKCLNLFFRVQFGLVGLIVWNIKSMGEVNVFDFTGLQSVKYIKVLTIK